MLNQLVEMELFSPTLLSSIYACAVWETLPKKSRFPVKPTVCHKVYVVDYKATWIVSVKKCVTYEGNGPRMLC